MYCTVHSVSVMNRQLPLYSSLLSSAKYWASLQLNVSFAPNGQSFLIHRVHMYWSVEVVFILPLVSLITYCWTKSRKHNQNPCHWSSMWSVVWHFSLYLFAFGPELQLRQTSQPPSPTPPVASLSIILCDEWSHGAQFVWRWPRLTVSALISLSPEGIVFFWLWAVSRGELAIFLPVLFLYTFPVQTEFQVGYLKNITSARPCGYWWRQLLFPCWSQR